MISFTSLMIVLFPKTYSIRLITQAQRGFLLFLAVDQGLTPTAPIEDSRAWGAGARDTLKQSNQTGAFL